MAGYEPVFGPDEFGRPRYLNEAETDVKNILFALFLERGMYPSIPWMGGSIEEYLYQFVDDIDTTVIMARLGSTCSDFLDMINAGTLEVYKSQINGKPALVVKLPALVQRRKSAVLVGVTTNYNNELIYNFTENPSPI